jgi:hypothetical protein
MMIRDRGAWLVRPRRPSLCCERLNARQAKIDRQKLSLWQMLLFDFPVSRYVDSERQSLALGGRTHE